MKLILLGVSCVLVIPFSSFAQNNRTPTPIVTPPSRAETPGAVDGLITAVTGETITVKTEAANPVSFAVNKAVRYTDHKGKKIKQDRIRTGMRVRVYYQGTEDTRTATKVVLQG